jgi:hypothetical protein
VAGESAALTSWLIRVQAGPFAAAWLSGTRVVARVSHAEKAVPCLPWQVVTGVLSGALLLGLGASELPVRNALRRDAVEVIGAQE